MNSERPAPDKPGLVVFDPEGVICEPGFTLPLLTELRSCQGASHYSLTRAYEALTLGHPWEDDYGASVSGMRAAQLGGALDKAWQEMQGRVDWELGVQITATAHAMGWSVMLVSAIHQQILDRMSITLNAEAVVGTELETSRGLLRKNVRVRPGSPGDRREIIRAVRASRGGNVTEICLASRLVRGGLAMLEESRSPVEFRLPSPLPRPDSPEWPLVGPANTATVLRYAIRRARKESAAR